MEEEDKKDVFQSSPDFQSRLSRPKPQVSGKKYVVVILLVIVLGFLIFGITRIFTGGSEDQEDNSTPTPTIEVLPTDTPTPKDKEEGEEESDEESTNTSTPRPTSNPVDSKTGLDRSELSIHILNGSGVGGAAGLASDYLENLGYNVIQTGNADNFDYTETEIQIKSSQDDFLDLLTSDLSSEYSVGTTSTDLGESENAGAVVIIGQE